MYRVLLFGTGSGCEDLMSLLDFSNVEIVAYVDNNCSATGRTYNGKEVVRPSAIDRYEYDYVIITTRHYDDIERQLLDLNIGKDKIIGLYKNYSKHMLSEINQKHDILKIISNSIIEPYYVCSMQNIGRNRNLEIFADNDDYVRISSLELVAHEIYSGNIQGSVAELGVYQGDFAKKINAVFPDRRLYLFDTFTGFSASDILVEKNEMFSNSQEAYFSNTSEETVISKMPHPENCVIKKGYFPETAVGLEETFAFVSIDADLYNPIFEGLSYFYPRLSKGGYIFVHDYNNIRFKGAKEAVQQYCKANKISYFPLSDICGTVVIVK